MCGTPVAASLYRLSYRRLTMFGIGMPELIIILVIVLIIFGAGKLPEIGSGIGKGIRNFKKATSEVDSDDNEKQKLENKEDEKK